MIVDRLKPEWSTLEEKVQTDFIIAVMNEAAKMGIPLIGDFVYGDNGLSSEFLHYDRLRNFSLSEHQVIEQLIHNRAQLHGGAVTRDGYFRWQYRPKPPKSGPKSLAERALRAKQTEQAIADYIERLHLAGVRTSGNRTPEEMDADPVSPVHDLAYLRWPMGLCPVCQVPGSLRTLRGNAWQGWPHDCHLDDDEQED